MLTITTTRKLSHKKVIDLIAKAKNAEMCRDVDASRQIFKAFWKDIEKDPDVSDFEPIIEAELLRLCGFFLSLQGRSSCISNYQERGKDLLSRACRIYEDLGFEDKHAEARVMLALCYWYEGEIEECETILQFTEEQFQGNQLHPVYLQIRVNRLMTMFYKKQLIPAKELIEELKIPMELCKDVRLKAMYHNQAGIFYDLLKKFDLATYHHNEAIRFARRIKNDRFVATNLNNSGLLHGVMGKYETAYEQLEESLRIFRKLKEIGWLPHILDSKAIVLTKEGRYNEALEVIEEALGYFNKGEDYAGRVGSLWTKTEILLFLDRKVEALLTFNKLSEIAAQRIGKFAVNQYAEMFAAAIYTIKNLPFPESVKDFKRSIIRKSLVAHNSSITGAAESLGMIHQTLSDMLFEQFPEVREEFSLTARATRSVGKPKERKKVEAAPQKREVRKISERVSEPKTEKAEKEEKITKITPLDLTQYEITVDISDFCEDDEIFAFYVPSANLEQFAVRGDAVILVKKENFQDGEPFLIYERKNRAYDVGTAFYDTFSELLCLCKPDSDPIPRAPDAVLTIGRILGYCLVKNIKGTEMEFETLSFRNF